jgi:hypothetical protein
MTKKFEGLDTRASVAGTTAVERWKYPQAL